MIHITEYNDFSLLSEVDENTQVLTTDQVSEKILKSALLNYDHSHRTYSKIFDGDSFGGNTNISLSTLEQYGKCPQHSLEDTCVINNIIRQYVNTDDIIGRVVESIRVNVNTEYRLSYSAKTDSKKLERAKAFISGFNDMINLRKTIRTVIPQNFQEATTVLYLRHNEEKKDYVVDFYPLGFAEIMPYSRGGEPLIRVNLDWLKKSIKNSLPKNKRGKAVLFNSLSDEIRKNYPSEVYEAYIEKERYAYLDSRYAKVIRIGNNGFEYGLSSIFRALPSAIMLKTFGNTDESISRVKAKRILIQLMDSKLIENGISKPTSYLELAAYAHQELYKSVQQKSALYTAIPGVKEVKYVESSASMTDIDTINHYRNRILSTLGIGFLATSENSQSISTANISLDQLMRTINSISESLEDILNQWYVQILIDNGYKAEMAPKIRILDSEALSTAMKKELATTLFTLFNSSYRTAFEIMGISLEDEVARRKKENEDKLCEVFAPRQTAYTSSGVGQVSPVATGDGGGRPKDDPEDPKTNTDKQAYDEERNNL